MTTPLSLISKRLREDDDAYLEAPAPKKKAATPRPKKPSNTKSGIVGKCSLNKKEFGDRIKQCLALEKFAVQEMMVPMQMDVDFFRSFFGSADGIQITPAEYTNQTQVIVANLSNRVAGQVFGVSKIKNGNRYSTVDLSSMVVILYPALEKAQAWVTV